MKRFVILTFIIFVMLTVLCSCTPIIVKNYQAEPYTVQTPDTADHALDSFVSSGADSSALTSSKSEDDSASSKQAQSKLESKLESKPENKLESKLESKPENKLESKLESKPENKLESKLESKIQTSSVQSEPDVSAVVIENVESSTPVMNISTETQSPVIGQSVKLTITGADVGEYTLKISDDSIVSILDDTTVIAVGTGNCTITAEHNENGSSASVDLAVLSEAGDDSTENFYIDGILIVNKTYHITREQDPGGLMPECSAAFEQLVNAAAADGISIYALSDYRSYDDQEEIYNSYLPIYGQAGTDALCARPGHSEHQTGLAIDCATSESGYFPGTPAAQWLDAHCSEYGFIIRYPYGKDYSTGYGYEPWHIRYIGDAASDIMASGLSLEEYFGI